MRTAFLILCLLCSYWGMSQTNPTIGEIYDFEVGDLFQYRYVGFPISGPGSYGQTYIADKWYSATQDSVFYLTSRSTYSPPSCEDCPSFFQGGITDTLMYAQLDSIVTTLGQEPVWEWVDSLSSDCITNFDSLGLSYSFYEYDFLCTDSILTVNQNLMELECYFALAPGPNEEKYSFARGLCRVKSYWYMPETSSEGSGGSEELIYYIKSGQECGAYYEPLSVTESESFVKLKIYPNPSLNGMFFIDSKELISYEIYNSAGSFVLKSNEQNASQIDLSLFSSGIYFLYVFNKNGILLGVRRLVRY